MTKEMAMAALEKYIGSDLVVLAKQYGITTFSNGKQNKGWKGMTLELLAGLQNNNFQGPDGKDFELKSTAYYQVKGAWVPKETMAITMIKTDKLISTPFYESHCWEKLKSIIFCAVTWNGYHDPKAELLRVEAFDFNIDFSLIKEIEDDYELIREKCKTKGFSALTGRDGKWIQARTKGAGHGSISRAFYARKKLLKEIMKF